MIFFYVFRPTVTVRHRDRHRDGTDERLTIFFETAATVPQNETRGHCSTKNKTRVPKKNGQAFVRSPGPHDHDHDHALSCVKKCMV